MSRRGKHGLDKAALIKELSFQLCQLPAEEVILRWIPPAELYEIENHHAFQQAEAMVVGSENAQLQELAVASGFKLQGRDAKTVLEAGGGEIMIRMLNAIRYNAVLVQNDALTKCISALTRTENFFDSKVDEKKQLLVQLLKVRHTEVCDTELLESVDFNSLFESIEAEGEHYDNYREEAIRIGSNFGGALSHG